MSLLAPEDWQWLRANEFTSHCTPSGFCKVHKYFLVQNPQDVHPNLPLARITDIRTAFQGQFFETLPATLISPATLWDLGLTVSAGRRIWHAWLNRTSLGPICPPYHDDYGMEFVRFVLGNLERLRCEWVSDCATDDALWDELLVMYGVNHELDAKIKLRRARQDRTPAPLQHVRDDSDGAGDAGGLQGVLGRSMPARKAHARQLCLAWLKEDISERFMYLKKIMRLSRQRAELLQKPGGLGIEPQVAQRDYRFYVKTRLVLPESWKQGGELQNAPCRASVPFTLKPETDGEAAETSLPASHLAQSIL
ncbi:uncharacterized protein UV8b_07123 [Ustilaginoidea virens]|uniref:Uncharacterized protein n=1 Tax=Ustilaginoidea virens TaxID=1159556 RepID=A0A8E5MKN9_USTVR|nr:uncharacterized protein UV8b_07123 [Ustilaginoidea virens]QUC22882.1 hypothetical protein UV8b_07123 [Ustilaginoidea virens]